MNGTSITGKLIGAKANGECWLKRFKTLLLILGAGALAVSGLVFHLTVGYQAFPRSGSLIVIYGIALAGREIFLAEKSLSEH